MQPDGPLEIVIVDRPGASAGCACSATDPELPRFAGDLEWLRWQGASVARIDPRVTGKDLGGHAAALRAVTERGFEALPLVLAGGVVVHAGSYPSRELLRALLQGESAPAHGAGSARPDDGRPGRAGGGAD